MSNWEHSAGPGNVARLGSFMDNILSSFGLATTLAGWKIVIKWPEIVGEQNAQHSRAVRFSEGTLLVSVPDPVWRQELSLGAGQLLTEIHKQPGGRVIKKIQFVS